MGAKVIRCLRCGHEWEAQMDGALPVYDFCANCGQESGEGETDGFEAVEKFRPEAAPEAEVFYLSPEGAEVLEQVAGPSDEPMEPGWHWAFAPGLLYEGGEPAGPFATAEEAESAAVLELGIIRELAAILVG